MLLKRMYTFASLRNDAEGCRFSIKNRLADAILYKLIEVKIDGQAIDLETITIQLEDSTRIMAPKITRDNPIDFPIRKVLHVRMGGLKVAMGKHKISLNFESSYGALSFAVEDSIADQIGRAHV